MKASHRQQSLVLQVKKEKSASGAKSVHVNSRAGGYLCVFFLNKATLVVMIVHPSTVARTCTCNAAEEGRGKKGGLRESERDGMTSENSPRRGPAPCCLFVKFLLVQRAPRDVHGGRFFLSRASSSPAFFCSRLLSELVVEVFPALDDESRQGTLRGCGTGAVSPRHPPVLRRHVRRLAESTDAKTKNTTLDTA